MSRQSRPSRLKLRRAGPGPAAGSIAGSDARGSTGLSQSRGTDVGGGGKSASSAFSAPSDRARPQSKLKLRPRRGGAAQAAATAAAAPPAPAVTGGAPSRYGGAAASSSASTSAAAVPVSAEELGSGAGGPSSPGAASDATSSGGPKRGRRGGKLSLSTRKARGMAGGGGGEDNNQDVEVSGAAAGSGGRGAPPKFAVGTLISKVFEDEVAYRGMVASYDKRTKFYNIVYDDGDSEEMNDYDVALYVLPPSDKSSRTVAVSSAGTAKAGSSAPSRGGGMASADESDALGANDGKEGSASLASTAAPTRQRQKQIIISGVAPSKDKKETSSRRGTGKLSLSRRRMQNVRGNEGGDEGVDATGASAPKYPIGAPISKAFEDGVAYRGVIASYDSETAFYEIVYDDGDKEEMDDGDISLYLLPTEGRSAAVPVGATNSNKAAARSSAAASAPSSPIRKSVRAHSKPKFFLEESSAAAVAKDGRKDAKKIPSAKKPGRVHGASMPVSAPGEDVDNKAHKGAQFVAPRREGGALNRGDSEMMPTSSATAAIGSLNSNKAAARSIAAAPAPSSPIRKSARAHSKPKFFLEESSAAAAAAAVAKGERKDAKKIPSAKKPGRAHDASMPVSAPGEDAESKADEGAQLVAPRREGGAGSQGEIKKMSASSAAAAIGIETKTGKKAQFSKTQRRNKGKGVKREAKAPSAPAGEEAMDAGMEVQPTVTWSQGGEKVQSGATPIGNKCARVKKGNTTQRSKEREGEQGDTTKKTPSSSSSAEAKQEELKKKPATKSNRSLPSTTPRASPSRRRLTTPGSDIMDSLAFLGCATNTASRISKGNASSSSRSRHKPAAGDGIQQPSRKRKNLRTDTLSPVSVSVPGGKVSSSPKAKEASTAKASPRARPKKRLHVVPLSLRGNQKTKKTKVRPASNDYVAALESEMTNKAPLKQKETLECSTTETRGGSLGVEEGLSKTTQRPSNESKVEAKASLTSVLKTVEAEWRDFECARLRGEEQTLALRIGRLKEEIKTLEGEAGGETLSPEVALSVARKVTWKKFECANLEEEQTRVASRLENLSQGGTIKATGSCDQELKRGRTPKSTYDGQESCEAIIGAPQESNLGRLTNDTVHDESTPYADSSMSVGDQERPQKRKRGRPKGSRNKKGSTDSSEVLKDQERPQKGKRGGPKGSRNKTSNADSFEALEDQEEMRVASRLENLSRGDTIRSKGWSGQELRRRRPPKSTSDGEESCEANVLAPQGSKRGRPNNDTVNDESTPNADSSEAPKDRETPQKRKRGRPKGSKNKTSKKGLVLSDAARKRQKAMQKRKKLSSRRSRSKTSEPDKEDDDEWVEDSPVEPEERPRRRRGRPPKNAEPRWKPCKDCLGCLQKYNCGRCRACLDTPEFGGQGKLRFNTCIQRQCLKPLLPPVDDQIESNCVLEQTVNLAPTNIGEDMPSLDLIGDNKTSSAAPEQDTSADKSNRMASLFHRDDAEIESLSDGGAGVIEMSDMEDDDEEKRTCIPNTELTLESKEPTPEIPGNKALPPLCSANEGPADNSIPTQPNTEPSIPQQVTVPQPHGNLSGNAAQMARDLRRRERANMPYMLEGDEDDLSSVESLDVMGTEDDLMVPPPPIGFPW